MQRGKVLEENAADPQPTPADANIRLPQIRHAVRRILSEAGNGA